MTDYKRRADSAHERNIERIEAAGRRQRVNINLPAADLRRAARSLASRAEQIAARRDRDPVLRALADAESAHCRRIAEAIEAAMEAAR